MFSTLVRNKDMNIINHINENLKRTIRFNTKDQDDFYNPVDLNALLFGFEKTMYSFSKILGNGMQELWKDLYEKN